MPAYHDLYSELQWLTRFGDIARDEAAAALAAREHQRRAAAAAARDSAKHAVGEAQGSWSMQAEALERAADRLAADLAHWSRDVVRWTAQRYVTSFEVFLRRFLSEAVYAKRTDPAVSVKLGADLLLSSSPTLDDIADAWSPRNLQFSRFAGSVNTRYADWLGHDYLTTWQTGSTFICDCEQLEAQADVELLLAVRHNLVHRDGVPDAEYQAAVPPLFHRLDPTWLAGAGSLPAPDALLVSPGLGGVPTKLDEFSIAVGNFADHMVAIYP